MTLQELKTFFINNYSVDNYTDEVFIQWAKLVNRIAYRVMYKNNPDIAEISNKIYLDSDKKEYVLSTDFSVTDYGGIDTHKCGLYLSNDYGARKLNKTERLSDEAGFYIRGGSLFMTGEIERGEYSVFLMYIPKESSIVDMASTMNISDDYIHWAASMIKTMYNLFDNRDMYDISYSEQVENSFKNEYIDSIESSRKKTISASFDIF